MPQAVYFLLLPNVLSLDVSGPAETCASPGRSACVTSARRRSSSAPSA